MNKLLSILLLLIGINCFSQTPEPSGLPAQKFTGTWYEWTGYIQPDKGILLISRDTNFIPIRPCVIYWQNPAGDSSLWVHNGRKWTRATSSGVTPILDNYVRKGDSLILYATPTSSRKYSDSLYSRSVKYSDSLTRYVTPTQGSASYYPRNTNPSGYLTSIPTITLSGDVTGSGTTTIPVSVNRLGGQLPAYYLDRANHTGFQPISTITNLPASLDSFRKSYDSVYLGSGSLVFKRVNGGLTSVDISTLGVISFNSRTGAVIPTSGDYITDSVLEGTKKYYTDSLARSAINSTGPIQYNTTTGNISIPQANGSVNGYLSSSDWNLFNQKMSPSDTVSLSNRINLKANQAALVDTAAALRSAIESSMETIAGGPITSLATIGFNPGSGISPGVWIQSTFYQSQPPTAGLTGGTLYEFKGSGSTSHNLSATIGRQSATTPILSATITAPSQSYPLTFSQPSQPGSVVVTQSVSTPNNTNTTYTLTVTTQDGKTATATSTDTWGPRRFRGWVSDTTGIGTSSYPDATIQALTSEISASKAWSFNTGAPSGTQFYVIAYYVTAGALSGLTQNGFPALDAFNTATRSFTNAQTPAFTGTWYFYWSKNGQTTASDITTN